MRRIRELLELSLTCGGCLLLCAAVYAQEQRVQLSGAFTMGYSHTNVRTRSLSILDYDLRNRAGDLATGLDLSLGTYILDPRFIKLSFESNFLRDKGAFDDIATRYGLVGFSHSIDVLPTSPYPFRFHFSKQGSSLDQRPLSSARTNRRSLGFDWRLRKSRYPNIDVNYDSSDYDFNFVSNSLFRSRARSFFLGVKDRVKDWEIGSSFSTQDATEGITKLATDTKLFRLEARRELSARSNLSITNFYETAHFRGDSRVDQRFSFFDLHTDLSTQWSQKLSNRAYHQFYRNRSNLAGNADLIIRSPESGGNGPTVIRLNTTNLFNTFGDSVCYRVRPEITLTQAVNLSFLKAPVPETESITRFIDVTSGVGWSKTFRLVSTRASYQFGLAHARSNFGNAQQIAFYSYSLGVSAGNPRQLMVSTDYHSSRRPDIFQLGGFYTQKYLNAGIETQKLNKFRLSFSAGRTEITTLTTRGKEHFRLATYSASVDHRLFSVTVARNVSVGLRDLFAVEPVIEPNRMFRRLPVSTLVRAPLLDTSSFYTTGLARIRPAKNLEIDLRYIKEKSFFLVSNNVFIKQFDASLSYRLGKFTVTGGVLFDQQNTGSLLSRERSHFFIGLSRPFKLL